VALQQMVEGGQASGQRVRTASGPALVIGVPLSDGSEYYEIVSLTETQQTLDVILLVLCLVAGGVTVAGAGLGWYTGRMALRPLVDMAEAARGISAGDLDARLDPMSDPDLEPLTASFNDMVDQLQKRIERDRRFAADVSHELRSPLQTLAAAAAMLDRRRGQLDERTAAAAQLVVEETDRFQQLVTDLLEITRADGELNLSDVDVLAMARDLCRARGIDPSIVVVGRSAESTWRADGRRVQQIVGNLLDNAQCHGGGVVSVRLRQRGVRNVIEVDDAGPGVQPENREVIFRPFVRGPGAERRGDTVGAGLGLAIVARLADSLGGRATVTDRPGGGARFRVILARRPS
jgi:two-component system, OmpR family, sensor histidine kinase MtrB